MSRSKQQKRRGYPVCSGCSACSWYPKRLTREGKRTDKIMRREVDAERMAALRDESKRGWAAWRVKHGKASP